MQRGVLTGKTHFLAALRQHHLVGSMNTEPAGQQVWDGRLGQPPTETGAPRWALPTPLLQEERRAIKHCCPLQNMVIKSAVSNRQPWPQVAIEHLKRGERKLECPIGIKRTLT